MIINQTSLYFYYFETPRKRPNERSECDWSNLRFILFVGCDTQGVKNNKNRDSSNLQTFNLKNKNN